MMKMKRKPTCSSKKHRTAHTQNSVHMEYLFMSSFRQQKCQLCCVVDKVVEAKNAKGYILNMYSVCKLGSRVVGRRRGDGVGANSEESKTFNMM